MWASFAETLAKLLSVVFAGLFTWKAGRDSVKKAQIEEYAEVTKESMGDKDEIVKLSKASIRVRGSKWVRPND